MKIEIINASGNLETPKYAHPTDSGLDMRANIDTTITLLPFRRVLVPTGIKMDIPIGYEGQVRGRSGLALKNGITIMQGVGTIDSGYHNDIGVILLNLGSEAFEIKRGDKIAQLVISKIENVELVEVEEFESKTLRGENGYGSTGV